jgi:hypothetical protein
MKRLTLSIVFLFVSAFHAHATVVCYSRDEVIDIINVYKIVLDAQQNGTSNAAQAQAAATSIQQRVRKACSDTEYFDGMVMDYQVLAVEPRCTIFHGQLPHSLNFRDVYWFECKPSPR